MKFHYFVSEGEAWGFMDAKSLKDVYNKILAYNPKIKEAKELRINKVDSRRTYVYYPKLWGGNNL